MQIKSISAQNFRTLENASFDFAQSYCTISGRNNAGKSSLIRLALALFRPRSSMYSYGGDTPGFDYREDRTQWAASGAPIALDYQLELSQSDDPALLRFIEKFAGTAITAARAILQIQYTITEKDEPKAAASISGERVDDQAAREIVAKLRSSNLVFLYNSTTHTEDFYYAGGRRRFLYDFAMSSTEATAMEQAGKKLQRTLKRLAQEHTGELNKMLGRLSDRYDVEFAPLEGSLSRNLPLSINLKDKHVTVPLNDWGSGTQNRTHILMAILKANRIRASDEESRITPLVIVEEPESFLHPSAQSEFGRILHAMANETGIQILVTTHSPYMLNQQEPAANLLLARPMRRKKMAGTCRVDTSGEDWMTPFAEHLGVPVAEFKMLRPLFSSHRQKVLLVEGPIDAEYFTMLQRNEFGITKLDSDIDIAPYGGKDTLKNTLLLKFVLARFDCVFVTYDLDAAAECAPALDRLGLSHGADYVALGRKEPGRDAIEGLLPGDVLAEVNGRETDLVMALRSTDGKARRHARDELKKKYLEAFRARKTFNPGDLKGLEDAVRAINRGLSRKGGG